MVERHALERPDHLALVVPREWDDTGITQADRLTYAQIWHRVQQLMTGLDANGIGEGDRVLLAFPLCADLYALTLALFARGATAIFVDSSMGKKKAKRAIAGSGAKVVVSVNALLKYRWMIGALRRIPLKFSLDKAGWGVRRLDELAHEEPDMSLAPLARKPDDEALITYTSGSTGDPKGADRNHGLLIEQVMTFPELATLTQDYVAFPAFPVVALGGLCLGTTTVLPPMNFARPDEVNPAAVFNEMAKWDVNNFTAPPIYAQRLAEYVIENNLEFKALQLGVGGAPVSRHLCTLLTKAFPNTEVHVVYGSTEAEPIAHLDISEVLSRQVDAYPAGNVASVTNVAIVDVPEPAPALGAAGIAPLRVGQGQVGELVASGKHVNRRYVDNEAATHANKLYEVDGTVWHRTGDLAYQDSDGLIWLVGRLNYVIHRDGEAVHPFPIEIALDELPEVHRAAFVATAKHPAGVVVIVLAASSERSAAVSRVAEVLETFELADVAVRVLGEMPVDSRHNSKVDRVTLRGLIG